MSRPPVRAQISFDVFNGDADGICALHQLRLDTPRDAILVTGVKRDIQLLEQVQAQSGDLITVLDISIDANIVALKRHLEAGAKIVYFDHHTAHHSIQHPNLTFFWNDSSDVCSSLLVNKHLSGKYIAWAIVAAFGDNLFDVGRALAKEHGFSEVQMQNMCELGSLLNYNAYGEDVRDLHIHPAALYQDVHTYNEVDDFIHCSQSFPKLQSAYAEDSVFSQQIRPTYTGKLASIYVLPDEPWARRVSGLFANQLKTQAKDQSFAVLTPKFTDGYVVSVRSAQPEKQPASGLCVQFPTGGGRSLAAGINHLKSNDFENFRKEFFAYFEPHQNFE